MQQLENLPEKALRDAIATLQKNRTRDLKKALKKTKGSYIYRTLLKISRQHFYIKKETGQFTEAEVAILVKHGLIKN